MNKNEKKIIPVEELPFSVESGAIQIVFRASLDVQTPGAIETAACA